MIRQELSSWTKPKIFFFAKHMKGFLKCLSLGVYISLVLFVFGYFKKHVYTSLRCTPLSLFNDRIQLVMISQHREVLAQLPVLEITRRQTCSK